MNEEFSAMYAGGLLHLNKLNYSNTLELVITGSNLSSVTDGSQTTNFALNFNGSSQKMVWYEFPKAMQIDAYQASAMTTDNTNQGIRFYRADKTIIKSITNPVVTGVKTSIVPIEGVKYVAYYYQGTTQNIALYEFDVFGSVFVSNKYLFQDGEDIKKRDKVLSNDTKDVTPTMTAANAPAPYVVAASSQRETNSNQAWKVFAGGKWDSGNGVPQWLSLDFGSQKVIKKYEVGCYLYNLGAPTDFVLQGSNDNSNWVTLDTQSEVKWSTANEIKQFSISNNAAPYRQYRIYVTAQVGTSYLTLTKFRLHEAILVDVWSVVGTAPATKAMFDTDGMTDLSLITNEALEQLVSDTPEVLCWTDEEEIPGGFSTTDIAPKMTSDTAPSPHKVMASQFSSGKNPYYAFDKNNSSFWGTYAEPVDVSHWIKLDFGQGNEKKIGKIILTAADLYNIKDSIKEWELYGSNNDIDFIKLHSGTYREQQTSETYGFNNSVAFRYYRLNILSSYRTSPQKEVGLSEMEMFEVLDTMPVSRTANLTAIPHPQLLLPTGDIEVGELKSVKVEAKVQGEYSDNLVPTMTNFTLPSGKVSYSSYASSNYPYKVFNKDITDYGWLSNGKSNEWIQYQFPEPKKVARYIIYGTNYYPNTSPMKWDFMGSNDEVNWEILDSRDNIINWIKGEKREFDIVTNKINLFTHYRLFVYLNNGHGSYIAISEIELKELLPGEREFKIIASPDSGSLWKGKGPVTVSDLASVKANGWTPAEFNALTKDQLASLFPNGKVRLAFYLEQEKSTDIVKVDAVEVNEIKYKYTPSLLDAAIVYDSSVIQKPAYYVSRNDGVDWLPVNEDEVAKLDKLPEGKALRVKAVLHNGLELHGISFSWI